jgi:hypothetical protein
MRKLKFSIAKALAVTQFFAIAGLLVGVPSYANAIYNAQLDGGHGDQTGSSTVSVSYGSLLPLPGTFTNIFAQAIAGPNDIGVYGNVSAAGNPAKPDNAQEGETTEFASLSDSLYLQNAPANGVLALYVNVNGSIITMGQQTNGCDNLLANCAQYAQAQVELFANDFYGSGCVILDAGTTQPPGCGLLAEGVNPFQLPYSGNVVPLQLAFDATVDCGAWYDSYTNFEGSCFAITDFLDTAQISSIVVEDANGNPVFGASATSLSGVNYSLSESPVPEPSSLALLSSGLIGIVGLIGRKVTL